MGVSCNSFTNKVESLQSINKFTENKVCDKDIFQQTFVSLQDIFKTCLEDVLKTSSMWQFLVFQDILMTFWENEKLF